MISSRRSLAACATLVAAAGFFANADVVPTAPWGGVVDKTGGPCEIQWNLDTTGVWTNMSIFLMTGSNQNFVQLLEVVSDVDGTIGDGKYTYICPAVTPNAPIYFYAFSNKGAPVSTWTTRFTIADANGNTVAAPNLTQPDGSAVPWGTGKLLSGGSSSSTGGSSSSTGSSGTTGTSSSGTGTGSGTQSGSGSSSGTSGSASVPVSQGGTSASTDNGADTTVITVTPIATTTSSRSLRQSSSSSVSSGIPANAASSSSSSGSAFTGAAATSAQTSVAGLGLVLALLVGFVVA